MKIIGWNSKWKIRKLGETTNGDNKQRKGKFVYGSAFFVTSVLWDVCGGPVSGKVYSMYISDLGDGSIFKSESVSMEFIA